MTSIFALLCLYGPPEEIIENPTIEMLFILGALRVGLLWKETRAKSGSLHTLLNFNSLVSLMCVAVSNAIFSLPMA